VEAAFSYGPDTLIISIRGYPLIFMGKHKEAYPNSQGNTRKPFWMADRIHFFNEDLDGVPGLNEYIS
jgi:hypothetical protein